MTKPLTDRQSKRLDRLSPGHRVVGQRNGAPIVRKPNGEHLLVTACGRAQTTTMIERVRSYLQVKD